MDLLGGARHVGFVWSAAPWQHRVTTYGAGARVGLEGSGGIWMEREQQFVAPWEASASRSGGKRTLSVFSP